MNRYRKYVMMLGVVIITSIITPLRTSAQPPDAGCDPLDPTCPIDGGVGLLIAAGIGLGARKALKMQKEQE